MTPLSFFSDSRSDKALKECLILSFASRDRVNLHSTTGLGERPE